MTEEPSAENAQLRARIREADRRIAELEVLLGSADIGTLLLDRDLRIRLSTPNLPALLGNAPEDAGPDLGALARAVGGGLLQRIERVAAGGRPDECEVQGRDGRWFLQRIRACPLPGRGAGGGILVSFVDITEQHRTERRSAEAREFSEAIVEAVPVPLLVLTEGLRIVTANRAFHGAFGGSREDTEGRGLWDLADGRWDSPGLRQALAGLVAEGGAATPAAPAELEVRQETADGVLSLRIDARRLDGTRLILLSIDDVTARRAAETHQRALMAELNHRVKNTLAVVNAIAFQTLRRSPSMEAFVTAFEGRMQSLARTHSVLAEAGWEPADLGRLVAAWLEPHAERAPAAAGAEQAPIRAGGAPVKTSPQQSVALGMALHELATNAGRHGALSVPGGEVIVRWSVEPQPEGGRGGGRIRFSWVERGGPRVVAPRTKGFGTRFVEQVCAYDLGGEARLDFAPEGLRVELVFPAA